jgi:hypothetical protein
MVRRVKDIVFIGGIPEARFEGVDGGFELWGLEDFMREGGELKVKVVGD